MRLPITLLAVLAALVLAAPADAATSGTFKGKATSVDRDFDYGSVTIKVRGGKVTSVVIKSVTTTGCGGFMNVIFAPKNPETKIIKGSAKLKNGRLSVTYRAVASIEDQSTTLKARLSGSRITGTFESGDMCVNEGRFSAKR